MGKLMASCQIFQNNIKNISVEKESFHAESVNKDNMWKSTNTHVKKGHL